MQRVAQRCNENENESSRVHQVESSCVLVTWHFQTERAESTAVDVIDTASKSKEARGVDSSGEHTNIV